MNTIETMIKGGVIPRAVLYARFSSDNQREESIDAQLRAMREYCQRSKVVITGEYCDHARSATTDDRPEFLKMIHASKTGEFNLVIVHKLDRFSRNRYDSAYYKRELKRNGVALVSVLENLDDSPESIILESVLEGMSEYYSRNLAREVMKGMRESALQCKAIGGHAPFGYKINPETKRYEINEDEVDAVRMIFDSVLQGSGYSEIIRNLNARGFRTHSGKPFGKNSLTEILRNEKYRGVYIFNRAAAKGIGGRRNNHASKPAGEMIRIEGGVPAIISEEVWNGVQAILKKRKKYRPSNNTGKETYLLTGKIICGECGASYTGVRHFAGRNRSKYVCYQCANRKRTSSVGCQNKEIRREYLETFVLREIARVVFDAASIPKLVKAYEKYHKEFDREGTDELRLLESSVKSVTKKIDNIIAAVANTGSSALLHSLDTLEKERGELQAKIEEIQRRSCAQNVSEDMLKEAYSRAREMYLSDSEEMHRQLLQLYLDRVVVYREHIEVYLNTLPSDILRGETERSTGLKNGESLVNYLSVEEPKKGLSSHDTEQTEKGAVTDSGGSSDLHRKKADKSAKNAELSTFCGGGEGNRTPVRKPLNATFSGCRISFVFPGKAAGIQAALRGSFLMHDRYKSKITVHVRC